MTNKTTSLNGRNLIREFEGEKLTSYRCSAGVLTIGVGSTGPHVKPGMTITKAESDALFKKDLVRFEKAVNEAVKVPLTQNAFDSLVAFSFNVGISAFRSSTLLKKLNAGDYEGAADQFGRWTRAGGKVLAGLVRRRAAEAALFRKP